MRDYIIQKWKNWETFTQVSRIFSYYKWLRNQFSRSSSITNGFERYKKMNVSYVTQHSFFSFHLKMVYFSGLSRLKIIDWTWLTIDCLCSMSRKVIYTWETETGMQVFPACRAISSIELFRAWRYYILLWKDYCFVHAYVCVNLIFGSTYQECTRTLTAKWQDSSKQHLVGQWWGCNDNVFVRNI